MRAVVVGAGIFGVATARELVDRGHEVTLVEQYAPGHVRSASGGATRLLRCAHGDFEWYSRLAYRALELWIDLQARAGVRLVEEVGLLWLDSGGSDFTTASKATLDRLGISSELLDGSSAQGFYPSLAGDDLRSVLYEARGGVVYARRAVLALAEGLDVVTGRPTPEAPPQADVVVWACGSWLPGLFPGLVQQRIARRDVFFFGVDARWRGRPAFCDYDAGFYGHGEIGGLGMEVAADRDGGELDPDRVDRVARNDARARARAYLARRFPALAEAPFVGDRVCQYDLTPDAHFLLDRHPEHENWWLVGGSSGHGFKHGPAFAEYLADCIEGRRHPEAFLGLGARDDRDAGLRTRPRNAA